MSCMDLNRDQKSVNHTRKKATLPKKFLIMRFFKCNQFTCSHAAMKQLFQKQPGNSLQKSSIVWCLNKMSALAPLGTIFNSLYSFSQNNP